MHQSMPLSHRDVCQTCDNRINNPFAGEEDWPASKVVDRRGQRVGLLQLKQPTRPGRLVFQWKSKHATSNAFNTVVSDDPAFYRKFERTTANDI